MTLHKVLVGALLLVFGCLCTAQKAEIKTVPIKHVDPSSGEKMYVTYCAVCHGTDGKGVGPATPALKTPPSDLTTLAKRNGGKYPALQVVQTIKGDVALPAHGDKNMPVWGRVFRSLHAGADPSVEPDVQMRITNLTNYIESLQR
jgi:mono/diheme cytochrome c family protein